MRRTNWQFLIVVPFLLLGCKANDFDLSEGCVVLAQADSDLFSNGPNDNHLVNNVQIDGDCMFIEFSAGGCSGDSWAIELYGSEATTFSDPPQRSIRLSLLDAEECEAWISKSVSFDISDFKVAGGDVLLNLEGYEDLILYPN